MKSNKNTYRITNIDNGKNYAICSECYKNKITTVLIEDWKPYDNGKHQSYFYYTCPIHTDISIITDKELPIK